MKKVIFIFLVFLFSWGCEKFPEDKFVSLRTARQRIYGKWNFSSLTIDGADKTEEFRQNSIYGCQLEFVHDRSGQYNMAYSNCKNGEGNGPVEWYLLDQKISMTGTLIDTNLQTMSCHILRLQGKKFKFKTNHPQNGKEYIFLYEKQ